MNQNDCFGQILRSWPISIDHYTFEFVFEKKDSNGDWHLLEATQRYPSERNFDFIAPLWQRLQGDQNIDANLQTMELKTQ